MHVRMPGSIIQASQGGTCVRTIYNIPITNHTEFEGTERESKEEDTEDATWVPGERDGHEQLLEEGDHLHHHQHQEEVGDVSCAISKHIRMPGSIAKASQGGTSPRTSNNIPVTNYHEFEETEMKEGESQEEKDTKEDATWVPGGTEEDNKRYLEFL